MPHDTATDHQKVCLTLSIEQAKVLADALDMYVHTGLGQIGVVAEHIIQDRIPMHQSNRPDPVQACQRSTMLCEQIQHELGFTRGESYGITSPEVSDSTKRAYEMERVVRKVIYDNGSSHGVANGSDSDGLLIRCTLDEAPECIKTSRPRSKMS